jgi:hypothetical protein
MFIIIAIMNIVVLVRQDLLPWIPIAFFRFLRVFVRPLSRGKPSDGVAIFQPLDRLEVQHFLCTWPNGYTAMTRLPEPRHWQRSVLVYY